LTMTENNDLVTSTQEIMKEALHKLGFDDGMYELVKEPLRFLEIRIPVRMDDGTVKTFKGYRAQHNQAVGPTKGGVRFHPDVNVEEVKVLSMLMTMNCGITNLPFGGGKGGVICDPREMSNLELERLSRGYVKAISQFVGPASDIPAPDVYTNSQIMSWMMDEYSKINRSNAFAFITGKPLSLGGSQGRNRATALGAVITIEEAAKRRNINIAGSRVVIQGFGNAGSFMSKVFRAIRPKIVAVWESRGAVVDAECPDIEHLLALKEQHGRVTPLFEEVLPNEKLFELDCDILIPAALSNQITETNAHLIKAKIVAEAANGPTTQEATKILTPRDV